MSFNAVIVALNLDNSETSNQSQTLSNSDWNSTHPNTTAQILIQEEKMNVEIKKWIMSENKTTLPSLRNEYWKTIKKETEKINYLLPHIPTCNIT